MDLTPLGSLIIQVLIALYFAFQVFGVGGM